MPWWLRRLWSPMTLLIEGYFKDHVSGVWVHLYRDEHDGKVYMAESPRALYRIQSYTRTVEDFEDLRARAAGFNRRPM